MKKRFLIVTCIYIIIIAQEVSSFKHLHRQKRRGNSDYDYQSEQKQAQQEEQQAQQEEQQAQQEEQQAQQEEQQAQQEEQQAQQEEQQAQQEEQQAQQEEQAAQEQQNNGNRYKRSMVHNSDPIWVTSPTIQSLNYQTVFNPAVPSSTIQTKTCIDYLRLIFSLLLEDRVNSLAYDTTIVVIS